MKIGHVHLKVRNLDRAEQFYRSNLGLDVTERIDSMMVFMSGSDLHHELALQQVGEAAATPGRFDTGLYHVAFEVPDRLSLAEAYRKLLENGVRVYRVDHRISWALYFTDPDGNGIEIYWDTRGEMTGKQEWQGRDRELPEEVLLGEG